MNSSTKEIGFNASYIEYVLPYDDLQTARSSIAVGFWLLVSFFLFCGFLGIVGIFVEYTALGSSTLSHEETNFNNIDIPII